MNSHLGLFGRSDQVLACPVSLPCIPACRGKLREDARWALPELLALSHNYAPSTVPQWHRALNGLVEGCRQRGAVRIIGCVLRAGPGRG